MPSFASSLEKTLHVALSHAAERSHEYATLEHLLLALIDDDHASKVMGACNVDVGELKTTFEFEMFGTGVDEGQTTFRLRHLRSVQESTLLRRNPSRAVSNSSDLLHMRRIVSPVP